MRAWKLLIGATAIVIALAVVSACGGDADSGNGNGNGDGVGSDGAIPVGDAGEIVGWSIKVLSLTEDATQDVLDENQFNDPPAEGNQFVIAQLEVTRIDSAPDSPDGLIYEVEDSTGTTYTTFNEESRCGVIPDDLQVPNDLTEGETTIGNVCWSLPSDRVSDLVLLVDDFVERTNEPLRFALQ